MKTPRERLLTELLLHEDYAAFRARLLDKSLGEVRRRRWIRRGSQLLALAVCLAVMAGLSLVVLRKPTHRPVKLPCEIMRSVPLHREEIVTTAGLMATLVKTAPGAIARTGAEVVRTDPQSQAPELISDQQLLALFEGHPVALIDHGIGRKQLTFLNPNDEAVFVGELFRSP
jgi:hypothetical protein